MFNYMKIVILLIFLCSTTSWAQTSAVTSNTAPAGLPSDASPAEGGSAVTSNTVPGGMPSDASPATGGSAVTPNTVAGGLPSDEKPTDGKVAGQPAH